MLTSRLIRASSSARFFTARSVVEDNSSCSFSPVDGLVLRFQFRSKAFPEWRRSFGPSDWLRREFPKHLKLIEMVESRAQTALDETGRPQAAAILD
jgi:hypothetical protein